MYNDVYIYNSDRMFIYIYQNYICHVDDMLLFLYQPDILEYIFQWDIGIYIYIICIYIYWDIDEKCFYISQYPIDGGFHKWGYPKQLVCDGNFQSKMDDG